MGISPEEYTIMLENIENALKMTDHRMLDGSRLDNYSFVTEPSNTPKM